MARNRKPDKSNQTQGYMDLILNESKRKRIVKSDNQAIPVGFRNELCKLVNKYSIENLSGTADYLITDYLLLCLEEYNQSPTIKRLKLLKKRGKGSV